MEWHNLKPILYVEKQKKKLENETRTFVWKFIVHKIFICIHGDPENSIKSSSEFATCDQKSTEYFRQGLVRNIL